MEKSYADMTMEERVRWASSYVLDCFVTDGGKGIRSAMWAILSTAMQEAHDRGIKEGEKRMYERMK